MFKVGDKVIITDPQDHGGLYRIGHIATLTRPNPYASGWYVDVNGQPHYLYASEFEAISDENVEMPECECEDEYDFAAIADLAAHVARDHPDLIVQITPGRSHITIFAA